MSATVERRAKYSQQDRDEMSKSGAAMSGGGYPIKDTQDLRNAIRAVGRGSADHDSIRKHIIKRAAALGETSLIPDSWDRESGALKPETKSMWSDFEQRETYNDLATALANAVSDMTASMDGEYVYGWLQDFSDSEVIFSYGGTLYACPYTIQDDGPVTMGDPSEVRPVTEYVPARSDGSVGEKRSAPLAKHTLEWRSERAPKRGDRETRSVDRGFEVRDNEDPENPCWVLRSYASVFNEPYMVGSGSYRYEETILPGAFKRTLGNNPDLVFRAEHGGPPLARTSSGTLRVGEDSVGFWYEADLNKQDPDVQRLIPKLQRKDLTESSFMFRCDEDEWNADYSKRSVRACDVNRGDVSIVTYGASPVTGRHMLLRSEEEALATLRSGGIEALLDALVEWRDSTLLPLEERAGKALSASSMDTLHKVLGLVSAADDAVDAAQPLLADLMGVPNPDADDDDASDPNESGDETGGDDTADERSAIPPSRLDEFEMLLRMGGDR